MNEIGEGVREDIEQELTSTNFEIKRVSENLEEHYKLLEVSGKSVLELLRQWGLLNLILVGFQPDIYRRRAEVTYSTDIQMKDSGNEIPESSAIKKNL